METSEEQMSARTKITCQKCGRTIHTRQSANVTRCPVARGGCGATVYAPARPVRSLAVVSCLHCPAVWETRSKAGNMVRCPDCRKPRRVPAGIRSQPVDYYQAPPPPRRRAPRSSPPPRSVWSPPPAPPPPAPSMARPAPTWEPEDEWEPQAPERPPVAPRRRPAAPARTFTRPTGPLGLAAVLGAALGVKLPAPSPAPATVQSSPARSAVDLRQLPAVAPAVDHVPSRNEEKDQRRRQSVTALVTSLGGPFRVAYDSPLGTCECMNVSLPRESQRCKATASRAVVFGNTFTLDVAAYVCADHAGPLAAMAQRSDQVAVEIRNLGRIGR